MFLASSLSYQRGRPHHLPPPRGSSPPSRCLPLLFISPSLAISPHETPNPRRHRRRRSSARVARPRPPPRPPTTPTSGTPRGSPDPARPAADPAGSSTDDDERLRGTRALAPDPGTGAGAALSHSLADAAARLEVLPGVRRAQRRGGGPGRYRSIPSPALLMPCSLSRSLLLVAGS